MHYRWMSQQTWRAWLSSWYMSVMFMGGSIKEEILFCKPLETRTTGEDIFESTGQLCDIKWTLVVKMCWYLYWWRKSHDQGDIVEW
jgi:hypothetical protein